MLHQVENRHFKMVLYLDCRQDPYIPLLLWGAVIVDMRQDC